MRYATIFSGGGLFETGIELDRKHHANLTYAIEKDAQIARIWRKNHQNLKNSPFLFEEDFLKTDIAKLPKVDYIHASPPCLSFSRANRKGRETALDVALASSLVDLLSAHPPTFFSLENVPAYSSSSSYQVVVKGLITLGYFLASHVVNFAEFGVPQSRKRLILLAHRHELPLFPEPTDNRVSWWQAITDLLPKCPQVEPTSMEQLLIEKLNGVTLLCDRYQLNYRTKSQPCFTIKAGLGTDGKGAKRQKFIDIYHEGVWRTLTSRAIARIMGVPDTYWLPEDNSLAIKILGNGVPPVFTYQLSQSFLKPKNNATIYTSCF
ncbi:MAG: DNA cytosine methyltransferase [Xenococcaceae cyanobacterium]